MSYAQGNPLLDTALALGGSETSVFPLRAGMKTPLTTHGQNDATTDLDQIAAWWTEYPDANIGIACEPSGLYVVDVDIKGAKVGAQTLAALEAEHGALPLTYTVRTWSGGTHYYFRMPTPPLRNTAGSKGLGVDIDTRGNGYVVAPPSVLVEGGETGRYTVEVQAPVAPLPQWIVEKLTKRTFVAPGRVAPVANIARGEIAQAPSANAHARMMQLCDEITNLPEGEGTVGCYRLACMIGQYVGAGQIPEEEARAAVHDAVAQWTHSTAAKERGVRQSLDNGISQGIQLPRPWVERTTSGAPPHGGLIGLIKYVLDPSRESDPKRRLHWAACRAFERAGDQAHVVARALRDAAVQAGLRDEEARQAIKAAYQEMDAQ